MIDEKAFQSAYDNCTGTKLNGYTVRQLIELYEAARQPAEASEQAVDRATHTPTKEIGGLVYGGYKIDYGSTEQESSAPAESPSPVRAEWQDISTAPRDGTVFLAWVFPDTTFERADITRGELMLCRWSGDYFRTTRGNLPALWMPIKPPTITKKE